MRELVTESKLRCRQTQVKENLACCGTESSSEVEQSNDAWQSFKLLLFEVGCSHNMSVTLQAVQTKRCFQINESAFYGTLHVLLHKSDFRMSFYPNFMSSDQRTVLHNLPSWACVKKAFRYYINQIDSMLPGVCSVIDHR